MAHAIATTFFENGGMGFNNGLKWSVGLCFSHNPVAVYLNRQWARIACSSLIYTGISHCQIPYSRPFAVGLKFFKQKKLLVKEFGRRQFSHKINKFGLCGVEFS